MGQDGGLKAFSFVILPHAVSSKPRYLEEAFSFVILPHAVSSKPRYLEEEGGRKGGLWRTRWRTYAAAEGEVDPGFVKTSSFAKASADETPGKLEGGASALPVFVMGTRRCSFPIYFNCRILAYDS